ncbi:MAG: hypothetical protein M3N18_01175 [Actinomycetota bacterium]|nr:hypothetical protein [Actinomycetota bacterium]
MKRIRMLVISVAAVAMVLAFATNAMAARTTDVFCDARTFDYCSDTYRYVNSNETFTGWGWPRTDYAGFMSHQTGEVFSLCTYEGSDRFVDYYVCSSAEPAENPKKDNKGKNHNKGKNQK